MLILCADRFHPQSALLKPTQMIGVNILLLISKFDKTHLYRPQPPHTIHYFSLRIIKSSISAAISSTAVFLHKISPSFSLVSPPRNITTVGNFLTSRFLHNFTLLLYSTSPNRTLPGWMTAPAALMRSPLSNASLRNLVPNALHALQNGA